MHGFEYFKHWLVYVFVVRMSSLWIYSQSEGISFCFFSKSKQIKILKTTVWNWLWYGTEGTIRAFRNLCPSFLSLKMIRDKPDVKKNHIRKQAFTSSVSWLAVSSIDFGFYPNPVGKQPGERRYSASVIQVSQFWIDWRHESLPTQESPQSWPRHCR